MDKIAIFSEGQSDQIFIRHFLIHALGWEEISFQCFRLYADEMTSAKFDHRNDHAKIHFLIVNVGNDETVLSAVKERLDGLIQQGYKKIIALRDMYSEAYCRRAGHRIDKKIIADFVRKLHETLWNINQSNKIKIHFAIMELEAWLLGMFNLFERINKKLTIDYIEEKLNYNLKTIDPQKEFFKPSDIVDDILRLVNKRYRKTEHDIESICSRIENGNDFLNIFANGRCASFKKFYDEIISESNN